MELKITVILKNLNPKAVADWCNFDNPIVLDLSDKDPEIAIMCRDTTCDLLSTIDVIQTKQQAESGIKEAIKRLNI